MFQRNLLAPYRQLNCIQIKSNFYKGPKYKIYYTKLYNAIFLQRNQHIQLIRVTINNLINVKCKKLKSEENGIIELLNIKLTVIMNHH